MTMTEAVLVAAALPFIAALASAYGGGWRALAEALRDAEIRGPGCTHHRTAQGIAVRRRPR